MTGPKIAYLDIESSPLVVHAWSLRDLHVGLPQIREVTRMIGFGVKWRGDKNVKFYSEYHHSQDEMIAKAWDILNTADAVVHYNGIGYDIPHLQREFVEHDLTPPSPFKNIDLYRVAKKNFKFPSHKLAYVSQRLLGDTKVSHTGHQLWVDCLEGDEETKRKAWNLMRKYCKQDVALLEPLHDKLTPWLGNQFNMGLYVDGELVCQKCGGNDLESRGTAYTATRAYPQWFCRTCGGWTRDSKSSWGVTTTGVSS